ncbi:MAG TPA: HAD family hydrolase [Armatimonadota bacterium]|jgi:hypothetical protein
MTISLLVCDVDGTLAPINRPPLPATVAALREFAARGVRLALASGKPVAYLSGFARALGLDASLIGENGAVLTFDPSFPTPVIFCPLSETQRGELAELRETLEREFGAALSFQPNQVCVTAFPYPDSGLTPRELYQCAVGLGLEEITLYEHADSLDCAPRGVDKGAALRRLAAELDVPLSETAAVGDGGNDLPMFPVAGVSVCVGANPELAAAATYAAATIGEALDWLRPRIG